MTSYPCHSHQIGIISGSRRPRTSCSWATRLEPALLVPLGGSADPTWAAMNRLFVSGIYHNYTGRGWIPLFALGKFCAVPIVKIPGIDKPSMDAPSAMADVCQATLRR